MNVAHIIGCIPSCRKCSPILGSGMQQIFYLKFLFVEYILLAVVLPE